MAYLIVVREFGGHAIGDCITDPEAIEAAIADHAAQVVRVNPPADDEKEG